MKMQIIRNIKARRLRVGEKIMITANERKKNVLLHYSDLKLQRIEIIPIK